MQTLKLVNDLFGGLSNGSKRCTIRAGRRDVQIGPLLFESTDAIYGLNSYGLQDGEFLTQKVFVTEIRYTMFGLLTDEIARLDGANSAEELKRAMYRFYPHLIASDEITIVFFDVMEQE